MNCFKEQECTIFEVGSLTNPFKISACFLNIFSADKGMRNRPQLIIKHTLF